MRPLRLALLAAALALGGCKRSATLSAASRPDAAPRREVVLVERVAVSAPIWPAEAGPQPDARVVGGRVWEELTQSSAFELARRPGSAEVPDAGPGVWRRRARVNVEIALDRGEDERVRVVATVALVWAEEDEELAPWASHGCEGPALAPDALPAEAASLVDCAVGHAARSMVDKELVRRGDPEVVLRALDHPDPGMRQVAFAAIAERRIRSAVPRLLELLKSEDVLVRDGAIGALVALREPRAIGPMTELASFSDLDMMRRIIDAVGAIGGEDARSYLELVATGHDLPAVRELAEAALGRLARRERDAG